LLNYPFRSSLWASHFSITSSSSWSFSWSGDSTARNDKRQL